MSKCNLLKALNLDFKYAQLCWTSMHNCAGIHVPMTIMRYMNTKANKQHIELDGEQPIQNSQMIS